MNTKSGSVLKVSLHCQWAASEKVNDRPLGLQIDCSKVNGVLDVSWFWHSCLASILSPVLYINSLGTQYGSRVASAPSFVSGSALWCIAGPWILHHHVLTAHLGFQSTGEWLLVVFPLYLGSHLRLLSFKTVQLDHSRFSLKLLELLVWNRKEMSGMDALHLWFCGWLLIFLWISSWQGIS